MCSYEPEFVGFNTQPPEGGWLAGIAVGLRLSDVSTHSRLKAAGLPSTPCLFPKRCFNTQPPEGGWWYSFIAECRLRCFNTQPPEGGWSQLSWSRTAKLLFQHTAA